MYYPPLCAQVQLFFSEARVVRAPSAQARAPAPTLRARHLNTAPFGTTKAPKKEPPTDSPAVTWRSGLAAVNALDSGIYDINIVLPVRHWTALAPDFPRASHTIDGCAAQDRWTLTAKDEEKTTTRTPAKPQGGPWRSGWRAGWSMDRDDSYDDLPVRRAAHKQWAVRTPPERRAPGRPVHYASAPAHASLGGPVAGAVGLAGCGGAVTKTTSEARRERGSAEACAARAGGSDPERKDAFYFGVRGRVAGSRSV